MTRDISILLGILGITGAICFLFRARLTPELVSLNLGLTALAWISWKLAAIHKTLRDILK